MKSIEPAGLVCIAIAVAFGLLMFWPRAAHSPTAGVPVQEPAHAVPAASIANIEEDDAAVPANEDCVSLPSNLMR